MADYKKVPTTPEVWAVIHASHPDLNVFGSLSNPNGYHGGNPLMCHMMTQYGFYDSDAPLIEAVTEWKKGEKETTKKTKYYLFLIIEGDE